MADRPRPGSHDILKILLSLDGDIHSHDRLLVSYFILSQVRSAATHRNSEPGYAM